MLALTFTHPEDYDKVRQDDFVDILGFDTFTPGVSFIIALKHSDGTQEKFEAEQNYNDQQIEWVKDGSALNKIRKDLGVS